MAIQPNELRIGNFVTLCIINDEYLEFDLPISSIHSDNTIRLLNGKEDIGCFRIKQIKPIQLTEEWLLKFGFEKSKFYSAFINNSDFCIRLKNGEYHFQNDSDSDAGCHFLCKVKHVHQLQNLYFALTGEELTMKT